MLHWDLQPQGLLKKDIGVSSSKEWEMEQDSGSVICAATLQDDCLSLQGAVFSILKVVLVKVWANDLSKMVIAATFCITVLH